VKGVTGRPMRTRGVLAFWIVLYAPALLPQVRDPGELHVRYMTVPQFPDWIKKLKFPVYGSVALEVFVMLDVLITVEGRFSDRVLTEFACRWRRETGPLWRLGGDHFSG